MKNLPKSNPSLEKLPIFGDFVDVTLDRPFKAEIGLRQTRVHPGAHRYSMFSTCQPSS
jgi:hypothetical protein